MTRLWPKFTFLHRALLATFLFAHPASPMASPSGSSMEAGVPLVRTGLRQQELSVPVPIPSPRPAPPEQKEQLQEDKKSESSSANNAPLPDEEASCRASLTKLGIDFREQKPIREENGCEVPHPIIIDRLSRDIALEPDALVNCTTALALARFFATNVPDMAKQHLQKKIRGVQHASAYVCRPRRGTQKLSEHAFANALDIGAFILEDGKPLPVQAQADAQSGAAKFLDAFRKAACGPFKTVLGPGSDADHADHFHLDMKARRNDYAFCQ
ncbi:extensin family protein [Nitratireductor indicus C115]|uniref:Extensin family protein n=1 Tax=Nitratireductor indicus C115 TaxID=1231190 RepID=K2N7U1_9HYPH|nr:extensin family protein [Nitratireductor indicus]EKF43538.1 extensin family protein [Nitratireductor indicus C115]SFQ05452.1 Uncharacterized conserved protein [Nitratireductor indicus]